MRLRLDQDEKGVQLWRAKDMARGGILCPNNFNSHPWRRKRSSKRSKGHDSGYSRDFVVQRMSCESARVAEAQNIVASSRMPEGFVLTLDEDSSVITIQDIVNAGDRELVMKVPKTDQQHAHRHFQ